MKCKILIYFLIVACVWFSGENAKAEQPNGFTCSAAVGLLFAPTSFRVGYGSWELGYTNTSFFGANYLVRQDSTYTTFGLGILGNGFGFYGGVGWEPALKWGFHFRAEAGAGGNVNGSAAGGLLMGLSYWF